MDLALNNGTAVIDRELYKANLGIKDGKIAEISGEILKADREIDCAGKIILPGIIDEHVHFRVPGGEHKEDWKTASLAAIAGGVCTVIDMPNTNPALTTCALLEERQKIVEKDALVNFKFHFGATSDNFQELENAQEIASIKVFMGSSTGNLLVEDSKALEKIFEIAKSRNITVSVHCEDEELMRQNLEKFKRANHARFHNKIRDNEVEWKSIKKALAIQEKVGNKLHFMHVSTKEGLRFIESAKENGLKVTCEVTPHHLFLTDKDTESLGNFGKMNPPLRSGADLDALWTAIAKGTIDCIGTDHAPHTIEEKNQEYQKAPSGVPGIETMLPLLLNARSKGMISIEKIAAMCSENPARIFGLEGKGKIQLGFDADFTIVDLKGRTEIRNENLQTKCKWSPFNGLKLKGIVEKTIINGKVVFDFGGSL
ncbi:MAG: dihydroorotase family protein [Candidatus Diapherotrites archaeon]|nr:dihydroorotase family protein [Candidatus Diapherotrites archaeon]